MRGLLPGMRVGGGASGAHVHAPADGAAAGHLLLDVRRCDSGPVLLTRDPTNGELRRTSVIDRWAARHNEFMHWQRDRRWTWRDVLCRLGLHWPRSWEAPAKGDQTAYQELLCQACRYRIGLRPVPLELPPPQWTSLASISALVQRQTQEEIA
jgi:hypothetical protein